MFRVHTVEMLNCAEVTAVAVLIAAEANSRVIERVGEVIMEGVYDNFTLTNGNFVRIFSSLSHIEIWTSIDINSAAIEEIVWRVVRHPKVSVISEGN